MSPAWRFAPFADLSPADLHDILRLRAEVFVVEQACAFQDVDGADPLAWHLWSRDGEGIAAYARLIKPGIKFREPSIGRIVTAPRVRGTGLGRLLVAESVARARILFPGEALRIGAQQRLERFYAGFGFRTDSAMYLEDDIPHVEMRLGPEGA